MRAADVMEPLPSARLDDALLPILRAVSQQGLPGLIVLDEQDRVVTCFTIVDLVRLVLPAYLNEQPGLARVFDEQYADQSCTMRVDSSLRAVVGAVRNPVPVARPQATVVELAALMADGNCALVLVKTDDGRSPGAVTAKQLLGALVDAAEDRT